MRILNRFRRQDPEPVDVPFTGACPVREHSGDDRYMGRCEHATYSGYCPRHGDVRLFVGDHVSDEMLKDADDRLLPQHPHRDFGPPHVRRKLGK